MDLMSLTLAKKHTDKRFDELKPEMSLGFEGWEFSRSIVSEHPQTGVELDINEPAVVYTKPKFLETPIWESTGIRDQAVTCVKDGVWYGRRETNKQVVKSVDKGETWEVVHTFSAIPKEGPIVTASGAIIVNLDGGVIQRSADGVNWTTVLTLGTNARARWPAFTSEGSNVYIGEYGSELGSQKVYKSSDDGLTWATIADETGLVRHIHFIREDPYNGDLWYGTGDSDVQCFVKKSSDGGTTWDTIGSGSQKWRATDIRFDEEYAYIAGDGLIDPDDGKYFGVFRYEKSAQTLETLRDDFDHPLYTCEWDIFGNLWLIGSAQHHATTEQEPKYSTIWVMDKTNKFIEIGQFPVIEGSKGGIARVVFDEMLAIVWGWSLPWGGSRVLKLQDYYHTGIRIKSVSNESWDSQNEMLSIGHEVSENGASLAVLVHFPKDSTEYNDLHHFLADYSLDTKNRVSIFKRSNGGVRVTKYKQGETSVSLELSTLTWEADEILAVGATVGNDGKIYLQSIGASSGVSTAVLDEMGFVPQGLDKLFAGCRLDSNYQLDGYVLACKAWPYPLSQGEMEVKLQQMYELVYP